MVLQMYSGDGELITGEVLKWLNLWVMTDDDELMACDRKMQH